MIGKSPNAVQLLCLTAETDDAADYAYLCCNEDLQQRYAYNLADALNICLEVRMRAYYRVQPECPSKEKTGFPLDGHSGLAKISIMRSFAP